MRTRTKSSRIHRIMRLREIARQNYEKADRLFAELVAAVPVGEVIDAGPSGRFTIVDNFANSNAAFRVARVSRLELKQVKEPRSPAVVAREVAAPPLPEAMAA